MRSRSVLRRLLALIGAIVLATGGLGLGTAAAAHAQVPVLSAENLCGALELRWSTGAVIGEEEFPTVVRRNDVAIYEFQMSHTGSLRFGAADGDVFLVQRPGLEDGYFEHDAPDDCAGTPQLYVDAAPECDSLVLTLTNLGTEPVAGLVLLTPETGPFGEELAPVAPGTTQVPVPLADGAEYGVATGPVHIDSPIWWSGRYARPAGCDEPAPSSAPAPATAEAAGAGGGLPATGGTPVTFAVAGVVLIGAGLVVVLAVRRRGHLRSGQ